MTTTPLSPHPDPRVSAADKLGRFGHHPEPAIDFEIEVESLIGMAFDAAHGIGKPGHAPRSREEVAERISKALDFRVGGDPSCVEAKRLLRELAVSFSPANAEADHGAADMVARLRDQEYYRTGLPSEMPENWPDVLESRAAASYLRDSEGSRLLLLKTAEMIAPLLARAKSDADLIEKQVAELAASEIENSKLSDLAYYEVGGAPHNWEDRALAAERKLQSLGIEDWYCGFVSPGSQKSHPSYMSLLARAEAAEAALSTATAPDADARVKVTDEMVERVGAALYARFLDRKAARNILYDKDGVPEFKTLVVSMRNDFLLDARAALAALGEH